MALTDNLAGYWKLDSNSNDSTANANNGIDTGSPSYANAGIINNCITLNGSSQYVTLPNSASLNFSSGGISMNAWVKISGTGDYIIMSKDDATITGIQYRLKINNFNPSWDVILNYPASLWAYWVSWDVPNWTLCMITWIYDNVAGKNLVFINGVLKWIDNCTGIPSSSAKPCIWMRANWYGKLNWDIDELSIWNRTIDYWWVTTIWQTATGELAALYNAWAGLTYPFATPNTTNFFQFM